MAPKEPQIQYFWEPKKDNKNYENAAGEEISEDENWIFEQQEKIKHDQIKNHVGLK